MRRWLPWVLLVPVLVIALAVGRGGGGSETVSQHTGRIASEVRCPVCEGLSAQESQTVESRAIRDDIRRRIETGQSDGQIRSSLVARYGQSILLTPPASGLSSLVWVLPVVALVCALAGLVVAFRRWGGQGQRTATDEDRVLVAQAQRGARS